MELNEIEVRVYMERLMGVEPTNLEIAVNRCLDECTQFPRISEILSRIPPQRSLMDGFWRHELRELQRVGPIGDFTRMVYAGREGKDLVKSSPDWFQKELKRLAA